MIYVFDLDGTLVTESNGNYAKCKPIQERINKVNELFKDHTIVIQTARGKGWQNFTEEQLNKFGVKYNVLSCGDKIFGHFYIDDKAIKDTDFFS